MTKKLYYPEVSSSPDFPEIEEEILAFWEKERVFEKSVEARPAKQGAQTNEWIFYDGPPFANGLPHYGHLLTSCVKDIYPRYQTMKGRRVQRRFGWDCHGLPAEMEAEKELKISGRAAIEKFGVAKFNDFCRTSVMKYTNEWRRYVGRIARWVDFDNDYKTMDRDYMESVLWAFKQLYDKGLVYESYRVMPYSWAAETPLSNFETRLDNSYREREDKAITVAFKLKEKPKGAPDADEYYMLAWTTTPWTLPSNLALAVKPDMEYVCILSSPLEGERASRQASGGGVSGNAPGIPPHGSAAATGLASPAPPPGGSGRMCYILAISSLRSYLRIFDLPDGSFTRSGKHIYLCGIEFPYFKGSSLLNLPYEPLFPYFADAKNAFRILDGSDFIEEGEGTGIVHLAPGFGEDDQRVCEAAGIPVICPVDERGRYINEIYDLKLPPGGGAGAAQAAPWGGNQYATYGKDLARKMRKEPTEAEAKLWNHLRGKQIEGYKFRRQQPIGPYIVDFVCMEKKLVVELDGSQHMEPQEKEYDAKRKAFLEASGCRVLRFWSNEALNNMEGVAESIILALKGMPPHDSLRSSAPPPGGSLRLKGLNVIAETKKDSDEPYSEEQLKKFGLANLRIIDYLKKQGKLIKQEVITHNYPHCWRTDTPLIYKAVPSWYVEVTKFKERMVQLNQSINWVPSHIRDGLFGKWLENARDWSISRNRFWGTPIPVWKTESGKIKVFGSIEELEKFFGVKITDLHKPFIDNLAKTENGETWRRAPDVFDCWFESGSMPFAQVHYPFENKEWFEKHFPADFIVEYVAQTRGWFYTLMVLATALFDKQPFLNCICHGVILSAQKDAFGHHHKLSKRLKNYADPLEMFDKYGADAMRWFLVSGPVMHGGDLIVSTDGGDIRDVVRLAIKPIWNAYHFFTLYANADGVSAECLVLSAEKRNTTHSTQHLTLMDRYILAKCRQAVETIEKALDGFDTPKACQAVQDFFEALNNWYIRRSRDRFWRSPLEGEHASRQASGGGASGHKGIPPHGSASAKGLASPAPPPGGSMDADKQAAYDTLYTMLHIMCRAAAPLLPLTLEAVWRGLQNPESSGRSSVHLQDFPDVSGIAEEQELTANMDRVRDICNAALAIRNKENIRVRQPLACVTAYISEYVYLKEYFDIIKDEINVKEVKYSGKIDGIAEMVSQIDFRKVGKRLGAKTKEIAAAVKRGDWQWDDENQVAIVAGETLFPGEIESKLEPKPGIKGAQALSTNDALVVLDLEITPELKAEGIARDVVRMVQEARKAADFHISDRIRLALDAPEEVKKAVEANRDYVAEQTLAKELKLGGAATLDFVAENTLEGATVKIGLAKVA